MTKINLNEYTPEQLEELEALFADRQASKEEQRKLDIEAYKRLVSDSVINVFPRLRAISNELATAKKEIREAFSTALEMKADLYGVKEGQQSHTLTSLDGKYSIRIGFTVTDSYDDTAETGIAMVKEYLQGLGDSDKAREAVDMVLSLLAKDSDGNLKASKIMILRKHAKKSGDPRFIEGVNIIMDAHRPIENKTFIRAMYKNEIGAWKTIPLGMTEAE